MGVVDTRAVGQIPRGETHATFPAEPTMSGQRAGSTGQGRPRAARAAGCLDGCVSRRANLPDPLRSSGLTCRSCVLRPSLVGTIAPNRMRTCQYHVSSGEGTRRARECTATAGRLRADSRAPQSPRRGAEAASSVYTASLYGGVAARSRAVKPDQAGAPSEESSEVFGALKWREVQISRIPVVPRCVCIFLI